MTEVRLYHALFSTCSQKVRYTLWRKQIAFDSCIVSLAAGEHLEDWYLALNPNGVVPTLQHGPHSIIDSSVICEYLDEAFPAHPLTPESPLSRARMRAWMRYFEEVPTTAIRAPSFNHVFIKQIGARSEEVNKAQRQRMPLRKHFYEKMGQTGFSEETIAESVERLVSCIDRVEGALAAGGPFLLGDSMTLADVVLLPSIVRMADLHMSNVWSRKTAFERWFEAMQADPAFEKTYEPGARLVIPASAVDVQRNARD